MKDSELTAITGVDGGRGGAVEGDVVINGETALSCIMSLIRKFYALAQEILRSRLNCQTDNCRRVFCTKELALSLRVYGVRVFLSEQLCAYSQGAPVNSVPSMRVKLEDMIWLSGTRAENTRHVTKQSKSLIK